MLCLLFGALAGVAKAVRDTVDFHWDRCVFAKIKNQRVRRWFRSNWLDRPYHPIWFLWDAWHCCDTASYMFIALAAVTAPSVWLFLAAAALASAVFNLLFHVFFVVR